MTNLKPRSSRLRRMLGLGRRDETLFDDQTEESPETEVSSTSSATLASHNDEDHDLFLEDPYADVRERMEALSARDRARYASHEDDAQQHEQQHSRKKKPINHIELPLFAAYTTYLGYAVLIICGHVRDLLAKIFGHGRYLRQETPYTSDNLNYYAPLLKSWENFYTRRLYHRIQDCFNRPIASSPGANIQVLERVSDDGNKTMKLLGTLNDLEDDHQRNQYANGSAFVEVSEGRVARSCLNLGSYNYLGFADDWNITCKKDVLGSLQDLPVSNSSSRNEFGTTKLHRDVEEIVARFLGKEDALVLNMGFNTNSTTIPALMGRGDLLISDELNHTSIVNGARASGAAIRIFRHNDTQHLEEILREAIVMGRPRTRRTWNKIMVVVEGIYSMEGEYCDLSNVVQVCKKYGAYIYLDEAHSIGAMGPTGRGCAEYCGVDSADIDVMMGTFTKSFGGMGGYIAGSKDTISFLRRQCAGSAYHNSLSPVVCQQILSSFKVIMGEDGSNIGKKKIQALRDNSNYFRMKLKDMGLHVLGHYDSPIMPVMLYNPTKIAAFSRECFKRGLSVVVVGFPAVPILQSRARFCISAGHTRDQLDKALAEIDEVADVLKLRYEISTFG
ncbi:AMP-dependent synthetase and ligase [Nitzschia inconspicua]|uniref:serine C-palmitoyltransferase n=1 Tax=Nitzschia inconspicua TaxID=303405 RepID=A0A9K3M914_9STRA|nr:AMP-dependent synthetase and ligase [Nitzschia inconspicua]